MSILTLLASVVNFDFAAVATEADEYLPTIFEGYVPSPEEEAEASELLNNGDFPDWSDDELEAMAEDSYAMDRACSGPVL